MNQPPAPSPPSRPLIPFIILGALGLLLLSWLAFMGHYLRQAAYEKSLRQAESPQTEQSTNATAVKPYPEIPSP